MKHKNLKSRSGQLSDEKLEGEVEGKIRNLKLRAGKNRIQKSKSKSKSRSG